MWEHQQNNKHKNCRYVLSSSAFVTASPENLATLQYVPEYHQYMCSTKYVTTSLVYMTYVTRSPAYVSTEFVTNIISICDICDNSTSIFVSTEYLTTSSVYVTYVTTSPVYLCQQNMWRHHQYMWHMWQQHQHLWQHYQHLWQRYQHMCRHFEHMW